MKKLQVISIMILCLLFIGFIPVNSSAQLSPEISTIIENSQASNAFWGIQVRDQKGNLIENLHGDKLIRPASNLKLITAGAILDRIGVDYRYGTILFGDGELKDSVWVGDLIVKGSGDPSVNGEFYNDNPLFVFEKWVSALKNLGIQSIQGNLVGFDGLFDDVPYPKGWEWDDLTYYYAPEISALSFNSNVVNLEVIADGPVGTTPKIEWSPFNTPYVEFINEQIITAPGTRFDESYRRILGTNTIFLRSTLPQGHYETEPLSVLNPSTYFMDTFYRYLEMRGIEIDGSIFINSDYYDWKGLSELDLTPIDVHLSEPMFRLVEWLNQESDNFFTEMMVKLMGHSSFNVQGTTELGLNVLKEFMHEMEIDSSTVTLRDGSGMSPATLIQLEQFNHYLTKIKEKEYFTYLYNSLAVAGQNGTLAHRFRNSEVQGKFIGKTGFVSGVRALSGYLTTQSNQELTVTIITNNYSVQTSHVDFIHQRILEQLYSLY
ncbi:MAG: D-alanyl-D-alanine carboxypeptidase/D-alanyl-D-alanine-endopeptidase [Balneolaceae bacterium]